MVDEGTAAEPAASATAGQTRRRSRQRDAGEVIRQESRQRILAAAAEEFAEHGYAGATVKRIAARAEMVVQTLYATWGTKRDLLRGVLISQLTGDPNPDLALGQVVTLWETGPQPEPDGPAVLEHLVARFCRMATTAAPGWRTYLDAVGTDPDIAADWDHLTALRRENYRMHLEHIPTGQLRAGLTLDTATDTVWAMVNPTVHDLMTRLGHYTHRQFQDWLLHNVQAAVLR